MDNIYLKVMPAEFLADITDIEETMECAKNTGASAREGRPIGFWDFLRYGLLVAAASMLLTSTYVWPGYLL
ncbi:MAG: hypothetical protein M3Q29_00455 [Chloroflexota bacterium]|nr:hypothetical protein [Chloroflexota bacterium]